MIYPYRSAGQECYISPSMLKSTLVGIFKTGGQEASIAQVQICLHTYTHIHIYVVVEVILYTLIVKAQVTPRLNLIKAESITSSINNDYIE